MKDKYNIYVRFFGVVIQMGVLICLGVFGGSWVDGKFPALSPWMTVSLSLVSVFIALYLLIREVIKLNK